MKKCLILLVALTCCAGVMFAVENEAGKPITLRAFGGYGYNFTWGHYGNFDVGACIPLNKNFEMDAAVEASTVNLYTVSFDARPLFPIKTGEFYLDTRLLYKSVVRDRMHDFAASFAVGYRMDYVDVRVGMFSRLMADFNRDWHSEDEILVEPLGIIYNIEVFVRPQISRWNLSFRFANFDDYQIERIWQPIFMLGGRFDPTDRLSILLQAQCKLAGMFHLNATFYDAKVRAGISYKF